ncbi:MULTISPECIES: tetratricopeptide repeat protein [unclassified Agarivorans]|uniref:tetratricopeptide repeat protein n=1 Tax=unclassified Agarivorans TaxID=2636026 RepID=UPI0026E48999|nr:MULTISPECIES: tetratricopeptide repeat protein [unclassified Agarivorans]MDO6685867.1 tetratricopeptide repeat protein [Agarivorans sp. 3_MG-2023]MDO6716018.1 tetratricopeptide repeat protein [Agarivorans sp. 2_MG-2023]
MLNEKKLLESDELLALSRIAIEREDYEGALMKLKSILDEPEIPVGVYALLGRVYAALELFEKAIIAFDEYLIHRPEVVPEKFHLGAVYREMGENEKALQIWDEVLDKAPDFPPVLYNQALYYLEEKDEDGAIEKLNYIIENIDPEDNHVDMANRLLSTISLAS